MTASVVEEAGPAERTPLRRSRSGSPSDHPQREAASAAERAARRERIRRLIEAQQGPHPAVVRPAGMPEGMPQSLPQGVFNPGVDAPDRPDVLYHIAGYVSLGYAAAFFRIPLDRLETAVLRGHLPAIKADESRNAPWMVSFWDVGAYLGQHPPRAGRGRPKGARNRTPEERAQEERQAAAIRARWGPRTDDQGADSAAAG